MIDTNTNDMSNEELNLSKQIQFLRLNSDLEKVNVELTNNQAKFNDPNEFFLKRLVTKAQNTFKESKSHELEEEKGKIEERIAKFKELNPDFVAMDEDSLKTAIDELFGKCDFSVPKELFAVRVILDGEYTYSYRDNGLKIASSVIYNSSDRLLETEEKLYKNYQKIAKRPFSDNEKNILLGTAAAALLLAVPAVGLAGAGLTFTGGAFSLGAVSLYACLLGGVAFGVTYLAFDTNRKDEIKRAWRKLSLEESARLLAIRCYMIEESKKYSKKDEIKEQLNDMFSLIDDLRADTNYALFIEEDNKKENREKIRLFHNFDNQMIAILQD